MIVIDLDSTLVFMHNDNPVCHRTRISLNELAEVVIAFNPTSSLYDEKNFQLDPDEIEELKAKGIKVSKVMKPFQFNRWYISKKPEVK
jgi:hypothetical protein